MRRARKVVNQLMDKRDESAIVVKTKIKKEYLAITTLGEGKGIIFTDSLVNLTMVRMGDGYNLLRYYLFHRGTCVLDHLATLSPVKIVVHCHAFYNDMSRKEMRSYTILTISGVID